jgi:hypothetical protein
MGRGSYAKRLTGQVSQRMPVLKPTIPPFYRRIAPELTVLPLETDAVPPVSPFAREKTPLQAEMGPTSSTAASNQAKPSPVFRPKSDLQESRFLNPPPARAADLAEKAEIIKPGEEQFVLKPDALKDVAPESRADASIRTSDNPKIDLGTPDFHSTPPRVRRSRTQVQKEVLESRAAIPARTVIERRLPAASFSSAGKAKKPVEETTAAQSINPPSIELHKPYKAKSARSEKSAQELQPRKNPMEKEALAPARQFEPRVNQGPAATRRQQQQQQAGNTGGVHIGSLEVKIMPPAPVIKPQQARPSPVTILSRSFTSSLGLSQG